MSEDIPNGTQMRLRKIDENDDLNCSIWAQDMDGKTMVDPVDQDEAGRLVIVTERAYADIVRRLRSAGLSRI